MVRRAGDPQPPGVKTYEGRKGEKGDVGPAGPQGPAGVTGATGPEGPSGPVGPRGVAGPTGPQGPMGPQGMQGVPGFPFMRVFHVQSAANELTLDVPAGEYLVFGSVVRVGDAGLSVTGPFRIGELIQVTQVTKVG